MSEVDWAEVRARLAVLRDRSGREPRGEGPCHHYQLDPPLTEADVAELEGYLGVGLPLDYRQFLLVAGTGGAGPHLGVHRVARHWSGGWCWGHGHLGESAARACFRGCQVAYPESIRSPFSGARATMEPWEEPIPETPPPNEDDYDDPELFVAAFDAWCDPGVGGGWIPGAVMLADKGCGTFDWLKLTGKARGTIWNDHRIDGVDMTPSHRNGWLDTFSTWYMAWLNGVEDEILGPPLLDEPPDDIE